MVQNYRHNANAPQNITPNISAPEKPLLPLIARIGQGKRPK